MAVLPGELYEQLAENVKLSKETYGSKLFDEILNNLLKESFHVQDKFVINQVKDAMPKFLSRLKTDNFNLKISCWKDLAPDEIMIHRYVDEGNGVYNEKRFLFEAAAIVLLHIGVQSNYIKRPLEYYKDYNQFISFYSMSPEFIESSSNIIDNTEKIILVLFANFMKTANLLMPQPKRAQIDLVSLIVEGKTKMLLTGSLAASNANKRRRAIYLKECKVDPSSRVKRSKGDSISKSPLQNPLDDDTGDVMILSQLNPMSAESVSSKFDQNLREVSQASQMSSLEIMAMAAISHLHSNGQGMHSTSYSDLFDPNFLENEIQRCNVGGDMSLMSTPDDFVDDFENCVIRCFKACSEEFNGRVRRAKSLREISSTQALLELPAVNGIEMMESMKRYIVKLLMTARQKRGEDCDEGAINRLLQPVKKRKLAEPFLQHSVNEEDRPLDVSNASQI